MGCSDNIADYGKSECSPALLRPPENFSTDGEYILQSNIRTAKITGASVGLSKEFIPIMTIDATGINDNRKFSFDIDMSKNNELAWRVRARFALTQRSK